jgi:hypothetical protein
MTSRLNGSFALPTSDNAQKHETSLCFLHMRNFKTGTSG